MNSPALLSIPFFLLLILIATAPIFFEAKWRKIYKHISFLFGAGMILFYFIVEKNPHPVADTFSEYFSFISLLAALYVVSGGIFIEVKVKAKPLVNVLFLIIGALLANVIGTTGASVLLIKPFIRMNNGRLKPYLIVFFIFLVSNIGGSLTPVGPPLFLGFLQGVPFSWNLTHGIFPWLVSVGLLSVIFLFLDSGNKKALMTKGALNIVVGGGNAEEGTANTNNGGGNIKITGTKNFLWLLLILFSVFLEPSKINWLPSVGGYSYVREIFQLLIAFVCFKTTNKKILSQNNFLFEPILEVAFLFFGIFFTMIPALEMMNDFSKSISLNSTILYWGCGISSSFLDNAPAYLAFLTSSMSSLGLHPEEILKMTTQFSKELLAISTGAVFFGGMTYIGNGPNFMVKTMAEEMKLDMPEFFTYIIKYAIPYLLPVLIIVWLIFF